MKTRVIIFVICLLGTLTVAAQTKRALVIGLGQYMDSDWEKINGDKDVPYIYGILKEAHFKSVTKLINQQATKAGIVGALKNMSVSCKPGDVVCIHYSGHGQRMTDVHNDELDGLDECWIPYDAYRKASATYHGEKHLTDDELNVYLNAIRDKIGERGKLLVTIDACFSGDGTRGDDDDEVARGVQDTLVVDQQYARGLEEAFETIKSVFGGKSQSGVANPNAKQLPERWITVSACKSYQRSFEMKNPVVGKLTYALYRELKNGESLSNGEFMRRIRKFVNSHTVSRPQYPELSGDDKDKYKITDILRR